MPRWDRVKASFFDGERLVDSFPRLLEAFVLDVKIFAWTTPAILVVALGLAVARNTRNPALFPLRVFVVAYTDVMRGCLQSVPRGQTEAAKSLGLSRSWIVFDILFPQAMKASIPPWLNTSIVMVKSTAYSAIVGGWELTYAAKETVERTLATFEIFGAVMIFYFVICYPLSLLSRHIEKRAAVVH